MSQKEQKNKIIEFQVLNQKIQQFQEQLQGLHSSIQESQSVKNTLDELDSIKVNQEILIPLGQGIFVKGNIKNTKNLISSVGSNVLVEKSLEDAKDLVKHQLLNLFRLLEDIEKKINQSTEELHRLQKEIIKEKQ